MRRRDEGYRPLVLLQRQRMKHADSVTRVFRTDFSDECRWTSKKKFFNFIVIFRKKFNSKH
jgi:hypothetical protein